MRERLGSRFGVAGRGFVSVGRDSKRLEQGGVLRALAGNTEIADGREVSLGGAVGMSGTKARLEPGAKFSISFCNAASSRTGARELPAGCASASSPGTLDLAWLYTPDMGTADVNVDGRLVATISSDVRNAASDVQVLHIPVDTDSASLDVQVRAPEAASKKKGAHACRGERQRRFAPSAAASRARALLREVARAAEEPA